MTQHLTAEVAAEVSSPLSVAVSARDRDTLRTVRAAIGRGDVLLAYQPVIQTAAPDKIAFYEGLARVLDADGRIIPAADFMGAVEGDVLGRELDALALELGLQALTEAPGLRLSVNMSARSIGYPRWNAVLFDGLEKNPTLAERLILEITERTAITLPDIVQTFMRELQAMGISFALDDFGSGFSSFRYLRDFCFDILKIDGEFIRGIHDNPDNQVMTQAILSLARHFDMFTVAESVEAERDARFLMEIGVDCLQGYYFGAPTLTPYWRIEGYRQRRAS